MVSPITPLMSGVLLSLTESVGDYALKVFSNTGSKPMLGLGMAVYAGLASLLGWLFKFNGLAITNAFWDATSNVLTMFMGTVIFNETYSLRQWIGMVTVTLGIALMY
jgi:uncharacterized membrane protein